MGSSNLAGSPPAARTHLNRDAQMKPCGCGSHQRLRQRSGRCQASWLCFWRLKTTAEVRGETLGSPPPLLPPCHPPAQPLELGTLCPSSPPPRLCRGSGRTMLGVPGPPLLPRGLPAGTTPAPCAVCFNTRSQTAGGKSGFKAAESARACQGPPRLSTRGDRRSLLPRALRRWQQKGLSRTIPPFCSHFLTAAY